MIIILSQSLIYLLIQWLIIIVTFFDAYLGGPSPTPQGCLCFGSGLRLRPSLLEMIKAQQGLVVVRGHHENHVQYTKYQVYTKMFMSFHFKPVGYHDANIFN